MGRPKANLDEEKITQLVGKGFTVEWVADFFGVSEQTLYAKYSESLRKGYSFRKGCLQAKQYKDAMKGNTTLLIWLGKQWLGQKDKTETSIKDADVDFGDLSVASTGTQLRAADKPN